ncbi:hypothetical protein ABPG77_008923 [Micractinium sp. CCAP 211/92]
MLEKRELGEHTTRNTVPRRSLLRFARHAVTRSGDRAAINNMPPAANPAAAAGAAGGQGQQQQQQRGGFLQGFVRMIMMWYMMKMFMGKGGGPQPAKDAKFATPQFGRSHPLDVHLFLSESRSWRAAAGAGPALWVASDVPLAEPNVKRQLAYVYHPSKAVQNNGSVYVHAVFTPTGGSPNPQDEFFDRSATFARTHQLNVYRKKRAAREGINLLSGKNSTDNAPLPDDVALGNETVIISYLKPNVTINMVDDFTRYNTGALPPHVAPLLEADPATSTYTPLIWFNDFWLLRDYLVPVNDTLSELTLHFELSSIASWKYMLMSQMDHSFSMQKSWGAMSDGESDEVKRIFLEGNPYFLALTMAVSLLHSVFDMLAFKNDIGFWKNNKSMKGLSARSVLINAFCQLVIFLYLLDSETSMVVLFSSGVGMLIEFWKVTKAMNVKVTRTASGLPWLSFEDRASYKRSKTDQYDATAMRYLSYALYPLVIGYAVYALYYNTHKSWYSWVLNSLVGAVYTFGFILMCPQLYLNYKLKSVAHLPWRQMTYKFLNTIVDDLFAWVLPMPTLHRLSVFRDDLIFLIYLYQRWIYRVDKKRANEFGYAEEQGDDDSEAEEEEEGEGKQAEGKAARTAGGKKEVGAAASGAGGSARQEVEEEEEEEQEEQAEGKKDK